MKKLLIESGIKFDSKGFIDIPSGIRRIKIDVGLSDNAIHSKIWLNKDHNIFKDVLVFGFEADPVNVGIIKDPSITNRKKIDYENIGKNFYVINCALSSGEDSADVTYLYQNKDPKKSSLFYEKDTGYDSDYEDSREDLDEYYSQVGIIKRHTVPQFTLNDFLDYFPWHKFPYIEYLKINTSGSDFSVIRGALKYLNRIAIITFNSNNGYINCLNNHYDIVRFLKENDFVDSSEKDIKTYKSFNIDPTFFNNKLLGAIQGNNISWYQIGLLE